MAKIFVTSFSLCLKNSDEPEKNRFFAFSTGARRLRVHFAAMPAGCVNQLLRGVQFNDCEDTNGGCMGIDTQWARMLAYITGLVDQELLLRTEYLAAENRILRAQLKGRLRLSDAEQATLGEIGHRLGRKALAEVANAALPDTILGWYRKLVTHKFDGSKACRGAGRPRIDSELER